MTSLLKKSSWLLLAAITLFVLWCAWTVYRTWYGPLTLISKSSVKVYPGSGIEDLAKQLQQQDLIQYPHLFVMLARMNDISRQLRYGEYEITPGMSTATLMNNIRQGRGMVQHKMTFIEGWTFTQVLQALAQDAVLKHTLQGKTPAEIMTLLGHPGQKAEGRFFPSTYHFIWGKSDVDVLRMAYNKMQTVMQEEWPMRSASLPYKDLYQALTAASLIEKETAIATERPIVAGVIIRRLSKGMRLQIDPTVVYGVGKPFGSTITKADLASETPYNTYRVVGLPPTPINMPGLAAIQAALHPDNSQYLFYVARGNGTHVFSVTYAQHLEAVKQYRAIELERQVITPLMMPLNEQMWHPPYLWHG